MLSDDVKKMTLITSRKTLILMAAGTLILIALAAKPLSAVEAQTTASPTTTLIGNNSTNTTSSAIELSQQPVLQERTRVASQTPLTDEYMRIKYTGNGTLILPNNNI